jgi:hypothetical protein
MLLMKFLCLSDENVPRVLVFPEDGLGCGVVDVENSAGPINAEVLIRDQFD